jgi:hypothetical protein
LCGLEFCPLLSMARQRAVVPRMSGRILEGPSPPSIFVGTYGYPRIAVGPLASPVHMPMAERLESPAFLYGLSLEEVYSIRSSLIRGRTKLEVKAASRDPLRGSEPLFELESRLPSRSVRIMDSMREMALSSRSVEAQIRSRKDLSTLDRTSSLDMITMPMGPPLEMEALKLIDNPRVPSAVERAASDTDLGAAEGMVEMSRGGIPGEHISRLLSAGLLGDVHRRRLVPTRWSITAVDDTLSRSLISKAQEMSPLDSFHLHKGEAFGNHFLIALYPPPFRFEMQEQWQKGSLWGEGDVVSDWEGPRGRRDYASAITGAYYAARLAVAEHLLDIRRCAGATVIRWITDEYWAPLGVWVIRESVRKALEGPPEVFSDRGSLIARIDHLSGIRRWQALSRFLSGPTDTVLESFL